MLNLEEVMKSKTHWVNPELVNPCTRTFVEWCIKYFPAGRTMSGVGDTYAHFLCWVNEQTHPTIIPQELVSQMWAMRQRRKEG